MKHFYLTFALLAFTFQSFAQNCDMEESEVIIHINTDEYGSETAWQLISKNGTVYGSANFGQLSSETLYQDTFCVPKEECLTFSIEDAYSDGIFAPGYFRVWLDGSILADNSGFNDQYLVDINCTDGMTCRQAISISEGLYTTPEDNYWYAYTPSAQGSYRISTCIGGNTCDTKIWVYTDCPSGVFESNIATTFYDNDEGNCGNLAVVQGSFDPGKVYYIRIGDNEDACANGPIRWSVEYLGAIVGCTDPNSCNYNPLATVDDGTCIAKGSPECPNGPDLVLNQNEFETTIRLDSIISDDDCLIQEGCVQGYGRRDVLRFSTRIDNIGEQDYYAGRPENNPAQFTYDNCHQHDHYDGYAEYLLFDENANQLDIGFKNGFCVIDLVCEGGGSAQYSCDNMGITAGCSDIYWSDLECQWIDITDVADGRYIFVNRVNWRNLPDALGRVEKDTANNWAQVCIVIDRSSGKLVVTLDPDCPSFSDCAGVVYGNTLPDCTGECGGMTLAGDLDENTMQQVADVDEYITRTLSNDVFASDCNDLNNDSRITVYDAALLNNCINYGSTHQHVDGGAHDHCNFPDGVLSLDSAVLSIIDYDLVDNYIDIGILNRQRGVVAFEFKMEGLQLSGVESLVDNQLFPIDISYSLSGHIIGLSYQDSVLTKTADFQPLCRLRFSNITAHEICIAQFIDAVSDNYAQLVPIIGGDCLMTTSTGLVPTSSFRLQVIPNPFSKQTRFVFENPNQAEFQLSISDLNGHVIRNFSTTRGNEILFKREELPAGIYLYQLKSASKIDGGKLIIQ